MTDNDNCSLGPSFISHFTNHNVRVHTVPHVNLILHVCLFDSLERTFAPTARAAARITRGE